MKQPYNQVKVVKRKSKISFLIIFIFLALTIVFSLVFAPLFGINYLSNLFTPASGTSFCTYYAVAVDTKTNVITDAQKEAQSLKTRGCAGVLLKEETYLIFLWAYSTKQDAQNVCKQINLENLTPFVYEIKISKNKKIKENEKEEYNKFFNFAISVVENLYQIATKLDKNELSEINANLEVKNLNLSSNFVSQEIYSNNSKNFVSLKKIILSITSILNSIANESNLSGIVPYSSEIKKAEIQILLLFRNL